jgi:leucyl/phenylalanyl-tRNA--protein transferase
MRQYVRKSDFTLSCNEAFAEVIRACAGERRSEQGTWITPDMIEAFEKLHAEGWTHSVEIWDGSELVGGLYGMCIGRVFFGESMFSYRDNASKFAMLGLSRILAEHDFALLDCQVPSQHLLTLGATSIARPDFVEILRTSCKPASRFDAWPAKALQIAHLLDK